MRTLSRKQRNQLSAMCSLATDTLADVARNLPNATVVETPHGPLIHIRNGGKILGVAHMDSVMWKRPTWRRYRYPDRVDWFLDCPQLDDRLGVWGLLNGLSIFNPPPFDILLTDSEEIGQSTAQYFETEIPYNWMFELDRAGDDCVLYEYEDRDTLDLMFSEGWEVGWGSFSDICYLGQLGIKGINFGIGYYEQHTERCFADIHETLGQLERVAYFLRNYHEVEMPHIEKPYVSSHVSDSYHVNDMGDDCQTCGREMANMWGFCPWCGSPVSDFPYNDDLDRYTFDAWEGGRG